MRTLTPEEISIYKTPEIVREKFGAPVSDLEFRDTYFMFYTNFYFTFTREKKSATTQKQKENLSH